MSPCEGFGDGVPENSYLVLVSKFGFRDIGSFNMKENILFLHSNSEEKKINAALKAAGYNVAMSDDPKENAAADIVLLCCDFMKEQKPSIQDLQKQFSAPVIVFAKKYNAQNAADSLDAGAYDYFALPFGVEHFARIRAALRNFNGNRHNSKKFSMDGLSINFQNRCIIANGRKVHLTPIEFRILSLLAKNQGTVLSHEQIINEIWGPFNSDNLVLRVNMANIRKKIEEDPGKPQFILTEMGVGYFLVR